MRRRRGNTGWLAFVMFLLFVTGLVFGMVIVHLIDKQHEEKMIAELQPIEEIIDETVNVYFPARHVEYGQIPRNSYDPDNYTIEDGFVAYYNSDGKKISHVGVDLSYHNGKVDWNALAASPVEFVMLRCGYRGTTEGGLIEDENFRSYAQEANERGIDMDVYFFSQAINETEAVAEAEYVLKLIEDYDISYPVAFDTEYVDGEENRFNQADLSREELTNITLAFLRRIEEAGYYPMVYASENWLRRRLDVAALADYDLWAPQYNEENDFMYDFTIWQYTESGSVPGVEGVCDINISFVDYGEYIPSLLEAKRTGGEIGEYNPETPSISITPIVE